MGWLKNLNEIFTTKDWDKAFHDRMAREQKEQDEIFDWRENIDLINENIEEHNAKGVNSENKKENEKKKEDREKQEKASDGLKIVIDGAKLQCSLCTNPVGDLKVNFDTPNTQDKKTATVKEKDMTSLIFKGNCTKSPHSESPCGAVMQLGKWKDVGTSKIQEQFPLLLKSTIKCNYGGVDIKITDCGQRSEPEDIGVISPEKKIVSAKWMCSEMENSINGAGTDEKVSLLVKTRNYKEGETITVTIDDANGYDAKEGQKEIVLTGTVGANGISELKEEVVIEEVTQKPKHKTDAKLAQEEADRTKIHITHKGKDYTGDEWKEFQDNWHDEMEREKAKKKSFW